MSRPRERLSAASIQRRKTRIQKRAGAFLRGPIPMAWLAAAAQLPGKAPLAVGVLVWFSAGLKKREAGIPVTGSLLGRFDLAARTAHDGLEKLESAGLVAVERRRGRAPRVTILHLSTVPHDSSAVIVDGDRGHDEVTYRTVQN